MTAGITCPRCARTSYNPNDVAEGYCGHCHDWTHGTVVQTTSPGPALRIPAHEQVEGSDGQLVCSCGQPGCLFR